MAIFGLTSAKELQGVRAELEALKAEQTKWSGWLLETARAEKFNLPDPSVYGNQSDLYRLLAPVASAVDARANAAALLDLDVYKVVGEREPRAITNHPFELLLEKPNPTDSRYEFIYATVAERILTGNCYWWINKADESAAPDELWIIPSHMIQPIPDENLFLKGYLYLPGTGAELFLQPHEIVHFKRFNPFSRFVGLSAIETIAMVAQGDLGMQEWNTKLFKENNARLPGILTFENMIQDLQWDKIKDDTREASKNRELMMLRGVGQGGVNWLQNANSQKDMEFLQGRAANRSEIYAILAPGLESMTDPSATEANANAGKRTFTEQAVYPDLVMMQQKITLSILPAYGKNLRAEFEDPRITDRQLELQEMAEYAKTHTVEEIRTKYYQDDPIGDERDGLFVVQINAQTGKPEPTTPAAPPQGKPATLPGEEPMMDTEDVEADNNALKSELDKWRRKAIKKIGRAVDFESDIIPAPTYSAIMTALPACKAESDVRLLFAKHINQTKAPKYESEIMMLASALNRAAEAVSAKSA